MRSFHELDAFKLSKLRSKAAIQKIVCSFYPVDDTASNELRSNSSEDCFAVIVELTKAQTKFQQESWSLTDEIEEINKNYPKF